MDISLISLRKRAKCWIVFLKRAKTNFFLVFVLNTVLRANHGIRRTYETKILKHYKQCWIRSQKFRWCLIIVEGDSKNY